MKEEFPNESWNKKRIFLSSLIFLGILVVCIYALLKLNPELTQKPNLSVVEGLSVKQNNNVKADIQGRINELQKEAQGINVADMASSSPQVQKVINDLKALQNYPMDQLKNACEQICNRL